MIQRILRVMSVALVAVLAVAGVASAHAVVYPRSVTADSYEKFALRVPTEKDSPTVKVRVELPADFAIARVRPLSGWSYTFEKSADGKSVTAIVWTGGKIGPTEFEDFEFQGKTPAHQGTYAFKIYQTYADGETVAWAGASDAKTPASVVEVVAGAPAADTHGAPGATAPATGVTPAPAAAPTPAAGTSTAAAYGGFVLGLAALVVALVKRR